MNSHVSGDPRIPIGGTAVHDALAPLTDQSPNNRGFAAVLRPPIGPISDDPKNDVGIVRCGSNGCARAYSLIVTLGLQLEKPPLTKYVKEGLFILPAIRAILKFGIGSKEFLAECDWHHGTQLTVDAESIEVSARYTKNTLPWDPVPDDQVDIPIPAFAQSFTVIPFSDAVVGVDQMGLGTAYTSRAIVAAPISNAGQYNVENTFRLWNGAQLLRVTNLQGEGGGAAIAAVVFSLSF